ncbi:MAG: tetratricopeptide repeat protein [Pirellulales bacterium]
MSSLPETLRQRLSLWHQQQHAEAELLLWRGSSEHSDSAAIWQLLGLVQFDRDARQAALDSLERASDISPLQPLAAFTLAKCYLSSERRELAVLVLRGLATSSTTPANLLPKVASSLGDLREFGPALAACPPAGFSPRAYVGPTSQLGSLVGTWPLT